MKSGLAQTQSPQTSFPPNVNLEFLNDMQDLFARRRFAHIGKWRFSKPEFPDDVVNGIEIWNRISQRAKSAGAYYIFSDELEMIATTFPEIIDLLPENCVLIDMGIGSREAIIDKIGQVLTLANGKVTEVIGVDILPDIINDAVDTFKEHFPHIKFTPLQGDMFKVLEFPEGKHRIAAVFGQTMFNLAIDPYQDELAKSMIVDILKGLRRHLRKGEKLLVPQNCGENIDEILAAYWEQQEVWENIFYLMRRDLPIMGNFDPEAFAFEPYWIGKSKIVSHTVVPRTTMDFDLGRQHISIGPTDRFYMHNTLIYPVRQFEELSQASSLRTFYRGVNGKKRMAFHFLEAEI